MIELAEVEGATSYHVLSQDLGGPPSVALAYMATGRVLSLATIETPFFGLDYEGYVDPRVPYWHLGMHASMDVARFLIEGREEQYLRLFFRDFAYNPDAIAEDDVQAYVMQMRQPGNLRASLNHYASIAEKSDQLAAFAKGKLAIPVMAWGGRRSFADHCIDSARALAPDAVGGVIEACGHWVFQERTDFILTELISFWAEAGDA